MLLEGLSGSACYNVLVSDIERTVIVFVVGAVRRVSTEYGRRGRGPTSLHELL